MERLPLKPILVIGQNPAQSSRFDNVPFLGTKSGDTLREMLNQAGVSHYVLANVVPYKTKGNKPVSLKELRRAAEDNGMWQMLRGYDKVIAVGRQAERAMNLAKGFHPCLSFSLMYVPHVSCRFYNRKGARTEVINHIRRFLEA